MAARTFKQARAKALKSRKREGRVLHLINRPSEGIHTPVAKLVFDVDQGILGDRWSETAWMRLSDGRPDPRVQVSLTNAQVMACFADTHAEGVFACGDNLYTDLSLSETSLPVGCFISVGSAVLQVSDIPNDACTKFAQRFGAESLHFVRQPENAPLRLRGIFCQIVTGGEAAIGDLVKRLP